MSDPVKPTTPQPQWVHILLLIVAAYASYLQGRSATPPGPTPAPIVNPPSPGPQPSPEPAPDKVSSIKVTDSQERVILGAVQAGRQFKVTAAAGTFLLGTPQPTSNSGEVMTIADNQIVCTLQQGGSLQVVSYSTGRPTIFMVHSNQAPQPPPGPDKNPDDTPPPAPSGKVLISIVEDAPNRPASVAATLNDFKFWESFRVKGHKVRIWNGGTSPSPEPDAVADITLLQASSTPLPGIVLRRQSDKSVIYSGKLPVDKNELNSLLGRFVE